MNSATLKLGGGFWNGSRVVEEAFLCNNIYFLQEVLQ
jgi:hypothetical protein